MTRNMEQLLRRHRTEAENNIDLAMESSKVNELKRCKKTVQSCLSEEEDSEDQSHQLLLTIDDVKVSSLYCTEKTRSSSLHIRQLEVHLLLSL